MKLSLIQILILIILSTIMFWIKPSYLDVFINKVKQLFKNK